MRRVRFCVQFLIFSSYQFFIIVELKQYGERCNPSLPPNEVIEDENAYCSASSNTVDCRYNSKYRQWMQESAKCPAKSDYGQQFGTACQDDLDCFGALICKPGPNATCSCPRETEIYDFVRQACVKREYGDICENDSQCRVRGTISSGGFTWDSSFCLYGVCSCGENTRTKISYINPQSGYSESKDICVVDGARVNGGFMDACDIDPIYSSDLEDTSVCSTNYICRHCPEDSSESKLAGKCRKLLSFLDLVFRIYLILPLCYKVHLSSQSFSLIVRL